MARSLKTHGSHAFFLKNTLVFLDVRLAPTLPVKLERQRTVRNLEAKRDAVWRQYDATSQDIERRKDALLDEISAKLEQKVAREPLFVLRWAMA